MVFKSLGFGTYNLISVIGTGSGIKRSGKIDVQIDVLIWGQHALSLYLTILNTHKINHNKMQS